MSFLYIPNLKFDANMENMIPEDDPAIRYIKEAMAEFGLRTYSNRHTQRQYIHCRDAEKIDDMTDEIRRVKGVESVISPMTVDLIESGFFGIEITPAVEKLPQTDAEIERFRERILNSSYAGQLITEDGRAAAIMVSFEQFGDLEDLRISEITGQIDEIAQRYRGPRKYTSGSAHGLLR